MAHFKTDITYGRNFEAQQRGYSTDQAVSWFADNIRQLHDLRAADKGGPVYVTEDQVRQILSVWGKVKAEHFAFKATPETGISLVRAIRQLNEGAPFPEVCEYDKKAIARLWGEQARLMGVLLGGTMRRFTGTKSALSTAGASDLEWGDALGREDVPLSRVKGYLQAVWREVVTRLIQEFETYRPLKPQGNPAAYSVCTHSMAQGACGNE